MEEKNCEKDVTFRFEPHIHTVEELLTIQPWEYSFRQLVLALNPEAMKTQLEEGSDA